MQPRGECVEACLGKPARIDPGGMGLLRRTGSASWSESPAWRPEQELGMPEDACAVVNWSAWGWSGIYGRVSIRLRNRSTYCTRPALSAQEEFALDRGERRGDGRRGQAQPFGRDVLLAIGLEGHAVGRLDGFLVTQ